MTKHVEYQDVFGLQITRKEALERIKEDPIVFQKFQAFDRDLQEEFIAFCMGNKGLKITYDPFFKFIFNPSLFPERLSEVLSLLLGEQVEVIEVLPNESDRIHEEGSLLIMDILVKLKSGAYANVEIQRLGYAFPGQRCACYSSDLLMRQFTRVKTKCKKEDRKFSYKELKKVYTIVFIEKSISAFRKYPEEYIHHSKQRFDSGLELDLLQEYIMIPLDVFREIPHNNLSKLEAWLSFIGSDEPKDMIQLMEQYPKFRELYRELAGLRGDLGGLIGMYDYYRKLLIEADKEDVEYMVEEQRREIEEGKKELEKIKREAEALKGEVEASKREIEESKREIAESKREAEESKREAEESKREAEESKQEAEESKQEAEELKRKNEELRKEMERYRKLCSMN